MTNNSRIYYNNRFSDSHSAQYYVQIKKTSLIIHSSSQSTVCHCFECQEKDIYINKGTFQKNGNSRGANLKGSTYDTYWKEAS